MSLSTGGVDLTSEALENDFLDLTGDSDDEISAGRLNGPGVLQQAASRPEVKDERDESGPQPDQKRRRNQLRKGRPEEGTLNLRDLEANGVVPDEPPWTRPKMGTRRKGPGRRRKQDEYTDSGPSSSHEIPWVEVEPTADGLKEQRAERDRHKIHFFGEPQPSERKEGWTRHRDVEFLVDDEIPESLIRLSQDSMVLAKVCAANAELAVAQVLEVLEDPHGEAGLAVRYGWFPSDIVDLTKLDFPAVKVEFPRQVFWQKDSCEDGNFYNSGKCDGTGWNDVLKWQHVAAACVVKHRSQLTEEELEACRQPLPLNEQQCSIDPASPELFFYSLQYDHTVKRFDTEWLERDAGIAQPIRRCQGRLTMMDVFCGIGNVSRAAQELTKAAAQEGRSEGRTGAPPTHCGFDVRWGVESEGDVFSAFMENIRRGDCDLDVHRAVSLETFLKGVKQHRETGEKPLWGVPPRRGSVSLMHCSPPCQSLSMLNIHSDATRIEKELFPVLDQVMELVSLVEPIFFTLEEVTTFLLHSITLNCKQKGSGSQKVRCVWRIVLPLLDMGYQVDVRILNAVHYAVPQFRKRVFMFAAKAGYELPAPPAPWMHYDGEAPVAAEPETETETVDDTEDDEETDAAAAAAVTPSTAAAAAQPARERRSAWSLTAGMHTDEALLNVPQPNWASVVVDSAEVHKGPEGPLLQALSSRDAIDDLPLRVEAGERMQTFQYERSWIARQSDYVKFLRTEEDNRAGILQNNWVPRAKENTKICLDLPGKRPHYDGPYPTVFGAVSRHAAHHLCPRPGAERLCTVAERKRLQCIMDGMRLAGPLHKQMIQVGNAVPLLMAWAVFGAVYKAAYGSDAPKPEFVLRRQIATRKQAAAAKRQEQPQDQSDGDATTVTESHAGGEMGMLSHESSHLPASETAGNSGPALPRAAAVAAALAGPSSALQAPPAGRACLAATGASPAMSDRPHGGPGNCATPESPSAAAAAVLLGMAVVSPKAAPSEKTPKRQQPDAEAGAEPDVVELCKRMGSPAGRCYGTSPGRHRAIRHTMDFHSPGGRPPIPETPAKSAGARRNAASRKRSLSPESGQAGSPKKQLGSRPGRNSHAKLPSAASATAGASVKSLPTLPSRNAAPASAAAAGTEAALTKAAGDKAPSPRETSPAPEAAKPPRPSPKRTARPLAFPSPLVRSLAAPPAAPPLMQPNGLAPHVAAVLQRIRADMAACEQASRERSPGAVENADALPIATAETNRQPTEGDVEAVDVVSCDPEYPFSTAAQLKRPFKGPSRAEDATGQAAAEGGQTEVFAADSEGTESMLREVLRAADGRPAAREGDSASVEVVRNLTNGSIVRMMTDAISDLTSEDMNAFDDNLAASPAPAAPAQQAAPVSAAPVDPISDPPPPPPQPEAPSSAAQCGGATAEVAAVMLAAMAPPMNSLLACKNNSSREGPSVLAAVEAVAKDSVMSESTSRQSKSGSILCPSADPGSSVNAQLAAVSTGCGRQVTCAAGCSGKAPSCSAALSLPASSGALLRANMDSCKAVADLEQPGQTDLSRGCYDDIEI